ncbi:uncharacterized protein BX663DRAFT_552132 [Cokeromyces recurvatus]|uniref:uncharacterized protein n=1 Tax=Cokeromyces recurvatus TaxID=90255 RepID=UPI00221EC751|nr:uncharacterized protein BX663DRAFT_552132 [Cokeromyces recurvatus]KAI7902727.1 hypothetical protein BX663DRAFT_552132 [Cokeromyces recurvatus]
MPNSASTSTYTTMMRSTSKDRPYTKDLFDLWAALLIQLQLTDHRSLFRTYPSTFTTDEAVEILSHLEFTQLVSTSNPLDPSNPILSRTTTTFNMSRTMAKTLGQHFINARLVENATDPQNRTMKDRGIWIPTPKGKYMIQDFGHRARVSIKHMQSSLARVYSFPIVRLERLLDDDQLSLSRSNLMEIFKIMMEWLPTDTIMIDDVGGIDTNTIKEYKDTFYGYQCFEWISEYTSVVTKEEAEMVAAEFIQYGWILQIYDKSDRDLSKKDKTILFKAGRKTQYYLTDKGRQVIESNSNQGIHHFLTGGPSIARTTPRSRTQSSTTTHTAGSEGITNSSSNSSIICIDSNNTIITPASAILSTRSKKEEHASRLLPTTAISPDLNTAPKAIITKTMEPSNMNPTTEIEEQVEDNKIVTSESVLQVENTCDFGFSSTLSTTSSMGTTVCSARNQLSITKEEKEEEETEKDVPSLRQTLEQLKLTKHRRSSDLNSQGSHDQTNQQPPSSQHARLQHILEDPLIRMYFRQFLKSCFCEENINFWVDYNALIKKMSFVVVGGKDDDTEQRMSPELIQTITPNLCNSLLVRCCAIYNTYFCPENAPNELNIVHGIRYEIIKYMQSTFTSTMNSTDDDDSSSSSSSSRRRRRRSSRSSSSNRRRSNSNSSISSDDGHYHSSNVRKTTRLKKKTTIANASNVPFGSISVSSQGLLSSGDIPLSFQRKTDISRKKKKNGNYDGPVYMSIREGVKESPQTCLLKIIHLYDQVNENVCRTMAQDSVPKFMKTIKYKELMQNYYQSSYKKEDKELNEDK